MDKQFYFVGVNVVYPQFPAASFYTNGLGYYSTIEEQKARIDGYTDLIPQSDWVAIDNKLTRTFSNKWNNFATYEIWKQF